MKFLRYVFIIIFLTLVLLIPSSSGRLTSSIADEFKGRFLIRVEQMDEAWYADPTTGKLHYLGRPNDALQLMQELGLGISNQNLNKLKGEGAHSSQIDAELAEKLSGRILLQTEENNQAWYVWPDNNQRYFIGRAEDAQRVFRDLGVGISEDVFKTLQLSDKYYQSLQILELAAAAVQAEASGQISRQVQNAYQENTLTKMASGDIVVIRFELTSPVASESYGYVERGLHYWRVNGDLMNRSAYLGSPEYRILESRADAEAILSEMNEMQTALGFYHADVNGYPLSQQQGDTIGAPGRMTLTNPNGFFGTLRDPVVYHEIDLRPDILDLRYFSNAQTYALLFRLPADTEFYPAGLYTLTPQGILPGRDLSGLNPEECPDDFVPVCGADGVTYTNECHARAEGVEIMSQGACPA